MMDPRYPHLTDRDLERLRGVSPSLVAKLNHIFGEMRLSGDPMMVAWQGGMRTTEEQQALYAQGRTRPGRIVTHADGVLKKSAHQVRADGYGHAVDCCFEDVPHYDEHGPWYRYGELGEAAGLIWGGRWLGKKRDRPHLEEPS